MSKVIDAGALREAVALGQATGAMKGDGKVDIPYVVLPDNCKVHSLLNLKFPYGLPPRKPDHIKQTVALTDAESFCKYVKLYADSRTRIFADPKALSFRAVLDYHAAPQIALPLVVGSESPAAAVERLGAAPEFQEHIAGLALRKSEQWDIWMSKNEKQTPQAEFAEFLEDNCMDIVTPEPARMLETARELTARTEVNFNSKIVPKNGATQFAYQEVVTAGIGEAGKLEVPDGFTIFIPVFFGEKPRAIEARLRFRINSGKLSFFYKLYRPAEVLANSFEAAVKGIGESLDADILFGSV